jgi:hypothetical protein
MIKVAFDRIFLKYGKARRQKFAGHLEELGGR